MHTKINIQPFNTTVPVLKYYNITHHNNLMKKLITNVLRTDVQRHRQKDFQ